MSASEEVGSVCAAGRDPREVLRQLQLEDGSFDVDLLQLEPGEEYGYASDNGADDEADIVEEQGTDSVIVVDNVPTVPEVKFDKLANVLRKIFSQVGTIRELLMPKDEGTGLTKGFAFIEFTTPVEAQLAIQQTDGYKLDKAHTFRVVPMAAFAHFMGVPDEYAPPAKKAFNPMETLHAWLTDDRARDQFAVRYQDMTEVAWNDHKQAKADQVFAREFWTESFVQWSSHGYFLATMHRQGAALWGWPGGRHTPFQRVTRFSHPGVRLIDFSPNEGYIITYSSHDVDKPSGSPKVVLNVWDTASGRKCRTFEGTVAEFAGGEDLQITWPLFRWAGTSPGAEDKYFARMGKGIISVYEAPSMGLLDKKSFRVEGLKEFLWSPAMPWLSMYVEETNDGNTPARVSILDVTTRRDIRSKNLFMVSDLRMFWHPQGTYFAAVVTRHTKSKKTLYSGFELFRTGERDVPVEVLTLDNKNDKVLDFAWEPKGHRMAIIHGDGARPSVSFYSMRDDKGNPKVCKLGTFPNKQANALFWSPAGRHLIIAGLKGLNGQLEFFDADALETMATGEHFMATDIDWDSTGRFVATSVTSVHQMENGFIMWSFSGQQLYKVQKDRFYQFLWRPRPPSLLTKEDEKKAVRLVKQNAKRYEEEDELIKRGQDQELMEDRVELMRKFYAFLDANREARELTEARRKDMRGGYDSGEELETAVETIQMEEQIGEPSEEIVTGPWNSHF